MNSYVDNQPLKEKFVAIYEQVFNGQFTDDEIFWDELFLLKINSKYLENSIHMVSEEELLGMSKTVMNPLFTKCLHYAQNISLTRRGNALQVCRI
jgi:hypothetical protein